VTSILDQGEVYNIVYGSWIHYPTNYYVSVRTLPDQLLCKCPHTTWRIIM
jgi:hypothetical protein